MGNIGMENLSTLFRDKLYRIPDYQRGYAWTSKQLEEFWNDIELLDIKKEHYLGVLTTQNVPASDYNKFSGDEWLIKNKNYSAIYIVDGQQRITTCLLLLSAIVEVVEKHYDAQELEYTSITDIKKRYFYEKKGEQQLYSMIFGYLPDDPLHHFLASEIYQIPNFSTIETDVHTKYTVNLKQAFDFFVSELKKLEFEDIQEIYIKLTTRLVFNIYKISEGLDVFVTFETMNNRGKELSVLELLKNRLIYLTTLIPLDQAESNFQIREKINKTWKNIYDYLGKNPKSLLDDDSFLFSFLNIYEFPEKVQTKTLVKRKRRRNHRMHYSFFLDEENPNEFILDEIFTVQNIRNGNITLKEIHNFITDLSKNVVIWYELQNPLSASYSFELFQLISEYNQISRSSRNYYLIGEPQNYVFDYFIKNTDEDKRIKYLETLIHVELISQIFISYRSPSNDFMARLSQVIAQNDRADFKKINSEFSIIFKEPKYKEDIIKLLRDCVKNDYKGSKRVNYYDSAFPINYVLSKYEIMKQKENKEKLTKEFINNYFYDNQSYNIEHIFPNSKKLIKSWEDIFGDYDADSRHNLKNSLGNLVRISLEKNGAIGNKSYEIKKQKFDSGTYSEKLISNNYENWDVNAITKRGLELITFVLNILGIPKLSKTEKLKILGLENVSKK